MVHIPFNAWIIIYWSTYIPRLVLPKLWLFPLFFGLFWSLLLWTSIMYTCSSANLLLLDGSIYSRKELGLHDWWVQNVCSLQGETVKKVYNFIGELKSPGLKSWRRKRVQRLQFKPSFRKKMNMQTPPIIATWIVTSLKFQVMLRCDSIKCTLHQWTWICSWKDWLIDVSPCYTQSTLKKKKKC